MVVDMSLKILPSTPLSVTTIPPAKVSRHGSPLIVHTLSERIYIPARIYKHPSALLLELCTSIKELHQIIPQIVKNGLYDEHLFQTKLVSLFCKFGTMREAARVFEPIEDKIDPMYHTMLKGYAQNSSIYEAFSFFGRMLDDGVEPVVYNFTYLLKVCGDNADVRTGKVVHCQMIVNGFSSNLFAMTGVVNMYAKCKSIEDAYKMFDRMPERDLVCWNTIISGFAQNGLADRALELVSQMHKDEIRPDAITVISLLPASANIAQLKIGKSIHCYAIRSGFESHVNVSTALLDMYSKCGSVENARLVFDKMNSRTVVSWNSMILGLAESGQSEESWMLFEKMLDKGIKPTGVTIMGALHACADLGDLNRGQRVHQLVNQFKLGNDVFVTNSLISMYCKCQRVDIAAKLFDNLQSKTLVSWNAMILGYAQTGQVIKALNLFNKMKLKHMKPDSFTMVSVIPALAELSILRQAKWIHGLVIRACFDKNIFVMTALVDMYAKCGSIHTARNLFDKMCERHVTTWNSMIDGYGTHGLGNDALRLFDEMLKGEIKPNEVTFLCIISACSHSGFVDKGRHFFNLMKEEYNLKPSMDHYGAMVDLLGRAGKLYEAWDFIQTMPIEPQITIFGAMLGACKIHKNIELGEKAAYKLFELNPNEAGYHVLLANLYAEASMWDKVVKVRTLMEKNGIQKTPGCSLVHLKNEVHTFYSGSSWHPQSTKIYEYLSTLIEEIKKVGYAPEFDSVHDVENDVKEKLLSSHSEKLAISFGLLNSDPGQTIHIRKNLRVCGDCHNATKYISLVTRREIIVRDMHRFHHFKQGKCSCGDYW